MQSFVEKYIALVISINFTDEMFYLSKDYVSVYYYLLVLVWAECVRLCNKVAIILGIILVRAEWMRQRNKVAIILGIILVRAECVRCPWLLA